MVGQPGAPVRVVVVDGDARMRRAITEELGSDSRTAVVGEAGTLREGGELVRDVPLDVLLVDVELGSGEGLGLMAYARRLNPKAAVVVLSEDSEDDALRALQLGAAGFMVKSAPSIGFVRAVLQVANGGAAIAPALSRRLVAQCVEGALMAAPFAAFRAPVPATT